MNEVEFLTDDEWQPNGTFSTNGSGLYSVAKLFELMKDRPVLEISKDDLKELRDRLTLPLWTDDHGYTVSPDEMMDAMAEGYDDGHIDRIRNADLSCPVIGIASRLLGGDYETYLLDGYHRLAKAVAFRKTKELRIQWVPSEAFLAPAMIARWKLGTLHNMPLWKAAARQGALEGKAI